MKITKKTHKEFYNYLDSQSEFDESTKQHRKAGTFYVETEYHFTEEDLTYCPTGIVGYWRSSNYIYDFTHGDGSPLEFMLCDVKDYREVPPLIFTDKETTLLIESIQSFYGMLEGYPHEVYGDPEEMNADELYDLISSLKQLEEKIENAS